ncbi:hypothetical protein [Methylorubrum extorquens]|uniref:Uncharacterized protein n=3 Tax=Methylorubrum extorquens TaxID=408 RepID=C5B6H2_METEA|nr:hypothetical protein [Methylorubrum extorquens]ACS44054.1 Hypothetical protein MexAM1_META2p1316 [Methylorubrum extorquens AM1]MCP1546080.1 hypothetical protein [Methylorubrum extorquens]MCP1590747.1 hypothetical protein [Methylorubrum extorquens]
MGFEARIGVGDTIVAMTPVSGLRNVALYLETDDGDLGDVVAEWRGDEVELAFAEGTLAEGSLHATAYLRARAAGAFDRREQAFADAAAQLEGRVLREMRGDLASRHRPWHEGEDAEFVVDSACAAAARLIHQESGPLARAPRGIRHDAEEHLAAVGVAAEAAWRAGPAGVETVVGGRGAVLTATPRGEVEILIGGRSLLARPDGTLRAGEAGDLDADALAVAVRAYLGASPGDVAAAAYGAMVARSREIGRAAADLEARAEVLTEERAGVTIQLAGILGVTGPGFAGADVDDPGRDLPLDELPPAPRI